MWALPELIEAASRTGKTQLAADALGRLAEATSIGQTDWAPGIYARCRALLSDGQDADGWYRQAVDRLSRTRLRTELARAHLLYCEWLRRERRRTEAREQLRIAHGMLQAMGMGAFADRAWRELHATGETARRRPAAAGIEELTAHEAQIARLARDGLTNREIGAAVLVLPHRPVPPGQRLRQARDQLPQPARPRPTRRADRRLASGPTPASASLAGRRLESGAGRPRWPLPDTSAPEPA
jgi:hypothetical protein